MKVILLVIDGFGIGELPDAKRFNDVGSNTYKSVKDAKIPTLRKLGLDNIFGIDFKESVDSPLGAVARLKELSCAKDTTTGHFELSGIITTNPPVTFANGFPSEVVEKLEKAFGHKIIGNIVASGTEIINSLGEEHLKTHSPIIYTSADSVLQIACHIDVFPIEKLYELCQKARKIMTDDYCVGRIIARPFAGEKNNFYRTIDRKDFGIIPPKKTMLDFVNESGKKVVAIGKIFDVFSGQGITDKIEAHTNKEVLESIIKKQSEDFGLMFVNCVDTDMLYGHRNNPEGYAKCLEELDSYLNEIVENINNDCVLIITSDHGCDPSTISTDHSREYVPLIIYGKNIVPNNLVTLEGFDTVAHTILDMLDIFKGSKSVYGSIKKTIERKSNLNIINRRSKVKTT